MQPQETFKAVDNKLFVFGVQPVDIVILLVGFLFVHGIIASLVVDIIYVIIGFYIAKRTKNRSQNIFIVLYSIFFNTTRVVYPKHKGGFL
ncbi:MAG: hypothetical protein RMJ67_04175 [Elusimicrobiota bacterium]|nr:hypothetical protein [Endomicrobiia bacterium]MCX7642173.1 hypothetical protein [Elusimicrobiales bacterium]MDW8165689.1 hypothetical protein [Elusimicrobiota bacterium]